MVPLLGVGVTMVQVRETAYRGDVLTAILIPVLAVLAVAGGRALAAGHGTLPHWTLILPLLTLCAGLLAEAVTLTEVRSASASDSGRLSGLITGVVIAVPIADLLLLSTMQLAESSGAHALVASIGATLYLGGTALRWIAKACLKEHFSHSLRVLPTHQVIMHGPYGFIRHPAYLGTLLIVAGNSLVCNSWSGLLMVLVLFPLAWHRMVKEETLLRTALGASYVAYAAKVKRILPWLL